MSAPAVIDTLALAAHGPVIPVLVIDRLEDAVPLAQALVDGGVRVLEITLRTPVALRCMAVETRRWSRITQLAREAAALRAG
jgi:2-dehydro-3-deoxyphosphogluconate aldolase/(4S)-4-hydroxy-2-oxoglutarate aldolase